MINNNDTGQAGKGKGVKRIRMAAALVALLAVAGCKPEQVPMGKNNALVVNTGGTLFVTCDRVNGVTCWSSDGSTLSCLPDWMLDNQAVMIFDREPQP